MGGPVPDGNPEIAMTAAGLSTGVLAGAGWDASSQFEGTSR